MLKINARGRVNWEIDQKDLFSLVTLRTVPSVVDMISINNFIIGRKAESFCRENHNSNRPS